jgi:hypothetical protein
MDGRWFTVLFLFVVPAALMGVTVVWFAANPVAILAEIAAMIVGGLYLLTYTESFV